MMDGRALIVVPPTGTRATPMPALVAAAGARASMRFLEFFTANIRNPHTRRAYYRAARNSSAGARAPAWHRSPPSSRCTLIFPRKSGRG